MNRELYIHTLRMLREQYEIARMDTVVETIDAALAEFERPTDADCISRQAAIDALAIGEELLKRVLDDMDVVGNEREKYEWGLGLIESYIADMKDLPSAQPEQQWIPCSERLPEPENKEQRRGFYLTTNGYGSVGMTRYEFYDDFQKTGWQNDIRIDAWKPLPEPWRG